MTRHWALVAPRRAPGSLSRVMVRVKSALVLSTPMALPTSVPTLRPNSALLALKLNSIGVALRPPLELSVPEVPLPLELLALSDPVELPAFELVSPDELDPLLLLTVEARLFVQPTILLVDTDTALLISEVPERRDRRRRVVPVRPWVVLVPCPVRVIWAPLQNDRDRELIRLASVRVLAIGLEEILLDELLLLSLEVEDVLFLNRLENCNITRCKVAVPFARLEVAVSASTVVLIPDRVLVSLLSLPALVTVRSLQVAVFEDALLARVSKPVAQMLAHPTEHGTTVVESRSRLLVHRPEFRAVLLEVLVTRLLISLAAFRRRTW